jgi:hypothetical protein
VELEEVVVTGTVVARLEDPTVDVGPAVVVADVAVTVEDPAYCRTLPSA